MTMWDNNGTPPAPDANKYEKVWQNIKRREGMLIAWRTITAADEAWLNKIGITGK